MSDRELLELAAKAAGIRHIEYTNDYDGKYGLVLCNENGVHVGSWSPLTDDGDALRLAVDAGVDLSFSGRNGHMATAAGTFAYGDYNNDPRAATRRAIVLAAAEIGKAE